MAPNASTTAECTGVLNEQDAETIDGGLAKNIAPLIKAERRQFALVWRNIIAFTYVHIAALYGAWLMLTAAKFYTVLFGGPSKRERSEISSSSHDREKYSEKDRSSKSTSSSSRSSSSSSKNNSSSSISKSNQPREKRDSLDEKSSQSTKDKDSSTKPAPPSINELGKIPKKTSSSTTDGEATTEIRMLDGVYTDTEWFTINNMYLESWSIQSIALFLYLISGLGITAGAHRLWAHRSYKARRPLRILLTVFNTIAFQDCALHWARDHRVHYKYSETDADPHNATRGFFFSHIGWLLCKKHPDVIEKGKGLDISDLMADPVLMFQRKYYMILMPIACFIIPTITPMYLWNESFVNSFFVAAMFRWTFILNATWLVNSAAHKWGDKPYDVNINPSQNATVAAFAFGEGWHNYHHVFPWDYKTAELGNYSTNLTTAFIDLFAKIGWAYDLKSVSTEIIQKRVERTGDGTHPTWGWGDKDQDQIEIDHAMITHQEKKRE